VLWTQGYTVTDENSFSCSGCYNTELLYLQANGISFQLRRRIFPTQMMNTTDFSNSVEQPCWKNSTVSDTMSETSNLVRQPQGRIQRCAITTFRQCRQARHKNLIATTTSGRVRQCLIKPRRKYLITSQKRISLFTPCNKAVECE
jgi:hypothetical protein